MDNQRLFLFIALSLVIMLLFNAWQEQFNPRKSAPAPTVSSVPALPQDIPQVGGVTGTTQAGDTAIPSQAPGQVAAPTPMLETTSSAKSQRIHVITDLLDVEIDSIGGDIRRAALPAYPERADTPDQPVQILFEQTPNLYVAQSGLLSSNGQSVDHHANFSTQQTEYRLEPGRDTLDVVLHWQDTNGLTVTKTYTFHRNHYLVDMVVQVSNGTAQEWSGRLYRQLQRTKIDDKNQSRFVYTYMGGVVSTPANKYDKVTFEDMAEWKPEQAFSQGGWVAMVQHYFVSAWIPKQDEFNHFYTNVLNTGIEGNSHYIIGLQTGETKIAAGQTGQFNSQLYVGPKEQQRLETVAPNLRLTVDYGVLTILAEPVYWLMEKIHGVVNNWGWSIVFVTLLVKLIFYKLSEAAYRSMANMRKFQPKLQALKERYGDDRQRMSQAMMEIYKKEKINPLGGCLPMLVQIPVFISLYWVLLESVELRHADFMLWITDLSSKDPYYVLPLIMGASMLIQQKLNPAPMDPVQKRVMQVLPVVFTLFFAFFPAGLVLYWVVNNILSILQQWYITRKIEAQGTNTKAISK